MYRETLEMRRRILKQKKKTQETNKKKTFTKFIIQLINILSNFLFLIA